MLCRECEVTNHNGIHARPASMFVKTASLYDSDVTVEKEGNAVDGKNVMGLLSLEVYMGSMLKITVTGEDEEEAMAELVTLVKNDFLDEE